MGVPKFFRWLSERYPCLCDDIKEYQIPEFDNLYLDMNGIIHVCSHPSDDPHFRITEEQILINIFNYIEVLFRLIRPKKLFFMAVDGVAPRAKMNQQRGRRFSSAKEAELAEKRALERGERLPDEKRFDSNCITPGTEFMARLHEQLKYFVTRKVSTDKIWQVPERIILSGHLVPGEGEHKIMDYIRHLRSKEDWDPSTRHCLYGLDADLIMLGLCTHEPNFAILREEVQFTRSQKRNATPETLNFNFLYLSLLRDYIDLEFQCLKTSISFPYDIEHIIDDWVLMGFLVGNDFIPNLPHFHITNNILAYIYESYKEVLPTLDGYINEGGVLNLPRFEKFLYKLADFDLSIFNDLYTDMKYFQGKTGRKMFSNFSTPKQNGAEETTKEPVDELQALIEATNLELFDFEGDNLDDCEALEEDMTGNEYSGTFHKEFSLHKKNYYEKKMEFPSVSKEVMAREAEGYVKALQWILNYYYSGCSSWGWFYPHHYSPFISDIKGFSAKDIDFDLGTPFLPFQQLLAVLPAASKDFLPKVFQNLMMSEESPIIDYYPSDFKVDLNGKKQTWEAVVLIPFIDEDRLLTAMAAPHDPPLTPEEEERNSHGPMLIYSYSAEVLDAYSAPQYFPEVTRNHAEVREVLPQELAVPPERLLRGAHPRTNMVISLYRPGFPSLNTVQFKAHLEKKSVKVFQHPSRGDNMILEVGDREVFSGDLESMTKTLVTGREYIYVSWPHLIPARIAMVRNEKYTVKVIWQQSGEPHVVINLNSESIGKEFRSKMTSIYERHMNRFGIDLGDADVIVYAYPLDGMKHVFDSSGQASLEMLWSKYLMGYPLKTVVLKMEWAYGWTQTVKKTEFLKDIIPEDSTVFMLGRLHYGYSAKVLKVKKCEVRIQLLWTTEPDFTPVQHQIQSFKMTYLPGHAVAKRLGISSYMLARVTGSIFVQSPNTDTDRCNIGLGLKFSKSNKEAVGYTKKEGTMWYYSGKTLDLVREYMNKFPELFENLAELINEDIFFKDKLFPEDSGKKVEEVKAWLKELERPEMRVVGGELLDEDSVRLLEETLASYKERMVKLVTMKLKSPNYLYWPKPESTILSPDPEADFQLLDRVVYVRDCHSIPVGSKGTIVGIEQKETGEDGNDCNWLYDVLLDEEVIGGFALPGSLRKNCYRLTKHVLINISFGLRKYPITKAVEPNVVKQAVNMALPSFARDGDTTPGSVTNFFKAYSNSRNEAVRSVDRVDKLPNQLNPDGRLPIQVVQLPLNHMEPHKAEPAEFSNVWNLLKAGNKNVTPMTDGNSRETKLPPFMPYGLRLTQDLNTPVEEQTEALKKLLRLGTAKEQQSKEVIESREWTNSNHKPRSCSSERPEVKPCGHISCRAEFTTVCNSMGIPTPNLFHLRSNGRVVCRLKFYDGFEVNGLPCEDNTQASESACCIGTSALKVRSLAIGASNPPAHLFPESAKAPFFSNNRLEQQERVNWRSGSRFMARGNSLNHDYNSAHLNGPMPFTRHEPKNTEEKYRNTNYRTVNCILNNADLRKGTNPFVPLQAEKVSLPGSEGSPVKRNLQVEPRQSQSTCSQPAPQETNVIQEKPRDQQSKRGRRKPRIAAKFQVPLNQ